MTTPEQISQEEQVPSEQAKQPIKTLKPGESAAPGGPRERPAIYQSTQHTGKGKMTQTAVNWKQIIPAETIGTSEAILTAYKKLKSDITGFVSWDNLAKETGIDVGSLASHMKAIYKKDPNAIGFSVDRMGAGTYVKIKDISAFQPNLKSPSIEASKQAIAATLFDTRPEQQRELLAELNSGEYPDVAEDSKGFFIVWADGRAEVGYKNKKDAIAFIEQGDRDACSVQYRERQKGERVRNIYSPDKSSSAYIHSMLFKEEEQKKEYRKKIAIHEVLFSEVENREHILEEEEERLEKEAMSQQSGGSNLKNSAWNTNWQFDDPTSGFDKVKKQVSQKAFNFFTSLRGQNSANLFDLHPSPLSFWFHYYRTIIPENDEKSAGKARNAITALDDGTSKSILPGFQQFQQEIKKYNIPLCPYFMVSKFSAPNGGIEEPNLEQFIIQEKSKPQFSTSHYQEHASRIANGQSVNRTEEIEKAQTFNMSEINTATADMLKYAISDRIKDGYTLNLKRGSSLQGSIRNMYRNKLEVNKINDRDPAQVDQASAYGHHYGEMLLNIKQWHDDSASINLTTFELRLILQNMTHAGGNPKTPPDKFKALIKTKRLANGWDSSDDNPDRKMLTLPPLRQLPLGEVVYDRGNGNMSYDHLVINWKQGLAKLIQNWGEKCVGWLNILQKEQGIQRIAQRSPEVLAAWQNVISLQSGNRTSAETLLDLFKDYPTWKEFNKNHVQKSLASEIKTVNALLNKLRDNPVSLQSFNKDTLLQQQLQKYAQEIISLGQTNPELAHARLITLSSELVQHYMQGDMNWKLLTLALHALNELVSSVPMTYERKIRKKRQGKSQLVSNGLTIHSPERRKNMIDGQGFGELKKYGYQVAKMMDFLSAIMYRSCHEQVSTPNGLENRFGHKYSTSSGISQGGAIGLEVVFAKLEAKVSRNNSTPDRTQVDVYEDLAFSLGQKTGANDAPIRLCPPLPWEQMVKMFNEKYPEAGYEFDIVNDSISRYLDRLEQNIMEAINKNRGDIYVVYHNRQGSTIINSSSVVDIALTNEENDSATQPAKSNPVKSNPAWTMDIEELELSPTAAEVENQVLPPAPDIDTVTATPPPSLETQSLSPSPKRPKPKSMTDPMNTPVHDPNARYIQKKKNNGRRLLRQNAGLGSIEERLQKAANKLDEFMEFKVADKIDLLLQKMHEENRHEPQG